MKGPSLVKQYNKMIENNWKSDKTDFYVIEQVRWCDYPDYGWSQVETRRRGKWKLVIQDEEKLKECSKKPNKELKCKECGMCALSSEYLHSYVECWEIQRLEEEE